MRADIKPRTVNGKTYTYRTKGSFAIEHNGITYNLGEMIPGSAMKKAHLFVRKFVQREWLRLRIPSETTATVIVDGEFFCSVMAQYKNSSVYSYTLN